MQKPQTRRGLSVLAVLAVLVIVLTLTAGVFYYEYQNQLNVNTQSQLESGVPKVAADSCEAANFQSNHPTTADFYPLLPTRLANVSIRGFGLATYWPVHVNNTNFLLYEIWNVGYLPNNSTQTISYIELPYVVNCTLGST